MAKFSIEIDGELLSDDLMKNIHAQLEKALTKAAFDQIARIRLRTQAGQDFKGGRFRAYTPAYARFRTKRGRPTTPDLLFTGAMLRAMQVTKSGTTTRGAFAEIGFASAGEGVKAAANQKTREFFGISKSDEKAMASFVQNEINLDKANE